MRAATNGGADGDLINFISVDISNVKKKIICCALDFISTPISICTFSFHRKNINDLY